MRYLAIVAVLIASGLAFSAGQASGRIRERQAQGMRLHRQTWENLDLALKGEAQAHASYLLYARHARRSGHPELAELFERAAQVERDQHFMQIAELAGTVGSVDDNLRAAIQAESYEAATLYRDFAHQAREVGDHQAAARFEALRADEERHRDAFARALSALRAAGGGGAAAQQ